MSNFSSIFIIAFCSSVLAQTFNPGTDYWLIKPSPTGKLLTRIQFVDTLYGWVSGDSGTVIHTTNGGLDWAMQNTTITDLPIEDLFFLNRRLGWGICNDYLFNGTKILFTTNGGANWGINIFPDTSLTIHTVYFLDSLTGYLGGAFPGRIFKTTNGGSNWFECHIDTNYCPIVYLFPKANFNFLNAQTGFVCGGQFDLGGLIWKTTDSGNNWLTYCVAPEPLKRIKVLSASKIIATGGDFEFGSSTVQSTDSGNTWIYHVLGENDSVSFFGIGQALAFRTPSEVWVPLSYGQAWGLNLDSGRVSSPWQLILTPNMAAVYDAVFVTPSFGWACGEGGVLLKYNSDIIGITNNNVPVKNLLYQNYPNPFNPATTISYYLARQSLVRITIYDINGREVFKSFEGVRMPGLHEFQFSANNLASGVYFYKIRAGDFIEAKKMVIVK